MFNSAILPARYSAFVAFESCVKKSGFMYSDKDFIIPKAFTPASELMFGSADPALKCDPPKPKNMLLNSCAKFHPAAYAPPIGFSIIP